MYKGKEQLLYQQLQQALLPLLLYLLLFTSVVISLYLLVFETRKEELSTKLLHGIPISSLLLPFIGIQVTITIVVTSLTRNLIVFTLGVFLVIVELCSVGIILLYLHHQLIKVLKKGGDV